ncbi:hypothetical protein BJX99DRAFT_122782 [Aspergillus californicus]
MKLTNILSLSSLILAANAADCTAPNQQVFSSAAVEMMWSVRAWMCPNAWWQSVTVAPDGGWCDAGGGIVSAYWGEWTISGMQSEQQCWDVSEEIINQCMWYDFASTSYNGGTWTWGSIYAGGWFWADNTKSCAHPVKRDADAEAELDGRSSFTLADGTVRTVDRRVWLDVTAEKATLVRDEIYA